MYFVELLALTHTYSDSKASTNILDYYRFPKRMEGEVRTPACKLLETGTVEWHLRHSEPSKGNSRAGW